MISSTYLGGIGDVEPAYFNRRGAFHTGATISTLKDVVLYDIGHGGDGNWYQYNGSATLPMKVAAGNTPGSTWVNVGAATVYDLVRVQLQNLAAAIQQVQTLDTKVTNLGQTKQDNKAILTSFVNLSANTAANKFPYFTAKDTTALADLTDLARTLLSKTTTADMQTVLALGSAASKSVGTSAGNIPDMSSFTTFGTTNVFTAINIAGSKRLMEGTASATFNGGYADYTLPLGFPSAGYNLIATDTGSGVYSFSTAVQSANVVRVYAKDGAGNVVANGTSLNFRYIAVGPAV